MTDAERDEWLRQLRQAAKLRDRAAEKYALRLARVRALVRDANEDGVMMTEIAKAAGIHRVRAYRLLDKAVRRDEHVAH